jgi:hypothetical protein
VGEFEGTTSELLSCLMSEWWSRVVNTSASGIFKIMMAEARNFPELAQFYVDEVVMPTRQLLGTTIERGIARGEFRALPVDDIVHAMVAPVLFMAMHKHSLVPCNLRGLELDPKSFMETQLELLLRGLQTGGAGAK